MRLKGCRSCGFVAAIFLAVSTAQAGSAAGFSYDRDTLAFANTTVFANEQGKIVSHHNFLERKKPDRYTRRCFVMTRTVEQFYKFARFDPNSPVLDESELHKRIRAVTRKPPWHDPLPPEKRIIFPGHLNLSDRSQGNSPVTQR